MGVSNLFRLTQKVSFDELIPIRVDELIPIEVDELIPMDVSDLFSRPTQDYMSECQATCLLLLLKPATVKASQVCRPCLFKTVFCRPCLSKTALPFQDTFLQGMSVYARLIKCTEFKM
jgi:hypothetical protein